MEDLKSILNPGELHMVKILVQDVKLIVRIGNEQSKPFTTTMGVPQGDCLSPILFTLYLAKALKEPNITEEHQEHRYHEHITEQSCSKLPAHLQDHNYSVQKEIGILIEPKYADDISWGAANCKQRIQQEIKTTIPKLTARGLKVNEAKNEDYDIASNGGDQWKKCKILGSLLDTKEDIKRRKILANNAYHKLRPIFEDKKLGMPHKIRVFCACVESVFLYNSEIWTIGKTTEKEIDSYQRRMLRNAINIKWPNKITTDKLYETTKQRRWSDTIRKRRLRWFGHAVRLPTQTPAKQALEEALRATKKQRGGQKATWLKTIAQDLHKLGYSIAEATVLALDREQWRNLVKHSEALCAHAPNA
jgi:hypothetical protein